jgi:hypothetical protein
MHTKSAKGAKYISLGQRPRKTSGKKIRAESPLQSFHALGRPPGMRGCFENTALR